MTRYRGRREGAGEENRIPREYTTRLLLQVEVKVVDTSRLRLVSRIKAGEFPFETIQVSAPWIANFGEVIQYKVNTESIDPWD